MNIDERLLAYKPISITLNFDWDKMTYDERVLARHNYIEEQKKKDPNYVGYDFIEVLGSLHGVTKETKTVQLVDRRKLISTAGQVVSIWNNELYTTFGSVGKDGYCYLHFKKKGKDRNVTGHRAVASTFIPIPEHLKEHRSHLVINHKNDVKTCNLRSNLEWCTQGINRRKAIETGAVSLKNFKFTITRPGPYFGKEYYFIGGQHLQECGFCRGGVHEFISKNKPYLCGTWMFVNKEEVKGKLVGIDKATVDYIKDPKYGFVTARGSVGTIVTEGPCKGEKFVIYGSVQLKSAGFDPASVSACILGKGNKHKDCTWEGLPREDALTIPVGLTEAQKEHIFGKSVISPS